MGEYAIRLFGFKHLWKSAEDSLAIRETSAYAMFPKTRSTYEGVR